MARKTMRSWMRSGLVVLALVLGCGRAIPLPYETGLGQAVINSGSTRTGSAGTIYPVTMVVPAVSGNPYAADADLPFSGLPWLSFGQTTPDRQTPFYFNFTYPPNNYRLAEAHLLVDTQRDSSDTEGIFVDGVFTGRPPADQVNLASTKSVHRYYQGNAAGNTPNNYFINFALAHYKQLTRNTMDLNVDDLVSGTPATTVSLVSDGVLPVVTGDDSPVFQAYLVLKGYTIYGGQLFCRNGDTYSFQNVFLHNDGNSIGQAAFLGSVYSPINSWPLRNTPPAAVHSAEWYFDAQMPQVDVANITITQAKVNLTVARRTTNVATSAFVINGIGVAESGFDTTRATTAVEAWESGDAATYWRNWVAAIPTTGNPTVSLDLVAMLGASRVKDLIAQGKLNLSFAGSMGFAQGSAATSTRTFGTAVSGPELELQGTYYNRICDVPYDPSSPLSDSTPPPSGPGDLDPPILSSISANQITANSATIQWLSDEGATTRVGYGVGDTATLTALDSNKVVFHSVKLTGLLPYKVYTYKVISQDANGNETVSAVKTFQTLR